MADKTGIAWADATINPCAGCSPVSPACDHCYAARMAHRLAANIKIPPYFAGLTDDAGKWTGKVNLHPHLMKQVLRWQKPRKIFVGSMTDLFHEAVPDEFLDQVFAYMALAPQHTFLLLTKRPERMRAFFERCKAANWNNVRDAINHPSLCGQGDRKGSLETPLPNVWLGVTIENQAMADARVPILLETPAAKRFVSIEPMLGEIALDDVDEKNWLNPECWGDCACDSLFGFDPGCRRNGGDGNLTRKLDWVICGGETGPGARPMHPDWIRSLRDQCGAAGVPFFFKQWGEWLPVDQDGAPGPAAKECSLPPSKTHWMGRSGKHRPAGTGRRTEDVLMLRVGKHAAGRLLDGQEWNEFPEVRS